MKPRFHTLVRDLHLYAGLFVSPFVLVYGVSVVFLAHTGIVGERRESRPRTMSGPELPANLESLDGRDRVNALQRALPALRVAGEIGFVRHMPKERRMVFPVTVPGRETTVDLDLAARSAVITVRETGAWEGLVALHKSPGQHLANIRMNWLPMRVWLWAADWTVWLVLFLTISGVYLWAVIRAERAAGLALLAAGALSFFGIVYGIIH